MSSNEVGYTEGLTVKRHSNNKKKRYNIAGPCAQRDYVKYLNDFDKNNQDSSFYLTTIRKIHYYLRIFYWELDRVVHTLFVVVCYLAKSGIGKSEWRGEEEVQLFSYGLRNM